MKDDLSIFSTPEIKALVQDMRNLLSQSYLSFLIGAGCSKIAGLPLVAELTELVLKSSELKGDAKELLHGVSQVFADCVSASIEDFMSEIVDSLSIAERRRLRGVKNPAVTIAGKERTAENLQLSLSSIKTEISREIGSKTTEISSHRKFVRAIHQSLQAGKTDRSVDYFVLNYDTLLEDALGLERVTYCDGFTGGATGWWDPGAFRSQGKLARVFKVHGSIDWCLLGEDSLPRRIRSGVDTGKATTKQVLIYPAATKYQETQRDPFAQMFHYLRQTLSPNVGKEMVLAICGYAFHDSHIDLEIENALYHSDGRLTIVAFVSTQEPEGTLKKWLGDPSVSSQIRVYANKGFFHGDKAQVFATEVPWWKFETLARILGGER